MALFNNKYRVETTRLGSWDYASSAAYFITICTTSRINFFGCIAGDKMILNEIGIIVQREWKKTLSIRPDMNLTLETFVVMPNHFHAIIFIGENEFNSKTKEDASNKFGAQSKNLGAVIRGFKSSVTIQARELNKDFGGQERYHEHIIRNEESYQEIQKYILNNPANWNADKFYSNA